MAFPAWPATVPEYAMLAGNTEEFADNKSSFQPEVGPSLDRRRTSVNNSTLRFNWVLTASEFTALETFWIDELKDGTLVFTRTHPRKLTSSYFKFAGPLKIAEFITPDTFLVPFDLNYLGDVEPGFSAEAQQFFDRLGTPESETYADQDADFIDALVDAGVWAKLDFLHIYAAAVKATGLTNLKSSSFTGLEVLAPTWTQDRGFVGNATNYINSQFNPATAGGNYVQNSACIFLYSLTAAASGPAIENTSTSVNLWPRNGANVYCGVNEPGGGFGVANADGSGLFIANRTASNLTTIYRNDVSLGSSALASGALSSSNFKVAMGAHQNAIVGAGASLSAGELTALYNACVTLLTARGAI